jgi:glycosyltransferase involved in cell wall biosynthesis
MKISVVMQVYLGDYPDSRSQPNKKFVRAIMCFLNQTYKNKELVIVSDGCLEAKRIYENVFNTEPEIKFFYIDRGNSRLMYTKDEDNTMYYRGQARQKGLEMATGDIITYMDSDDIILPSHLSIFMSYWNFFPKHIKWASNPLRIYNIKYLESPFYKEEKNIYNWKTIHLNEYGITEDFVINNAVGFGRELSATYAISHRRDAISKWEDRIIRLDEKGDRLNIPENYSEDTSFLLKLNKTGEGRRIMSPTYIVCHYSKIWDC